MLNHFLRSREIAQDSNIEYRSLLEKKAAKILTLLFKFYKVSSIQNPPIVHLPRMAFLFSPAK